MRKPHPTGFRTVSRPAAASVRSSLIGWALAASLCLLPAAGAIAAPAAGGIDLPEVLRPWRVIEERLGGDTVEDPFVVPALPFLAEGSTCGFTHDYDHACPYEGSTAPDAVYRYTCGEEMSVDIDLCDSSYDTKVYVFEDAVGQVIACNDDYCSYQSLLSDVPFQGGHDYYIVVDGYGQSCGNYLLAVRPHELCMVYCYQGSIHENEPPCRDDYEDNFNGGCCCYELSWTVIPPSTERIEVCGESGNYLYDGGLEYRDSDWYEIDVQQTGEITWCCTAEFPVTIILIDGREGCANFVLLEYAQAEPCQEACITRLLEPGIYWPWVGPSVFSGVPCPSTYRMTFDGYAPAAQGVSAEVGQADTRLHACPPGPIGSPVEIRFDLARGGAVRLGVYDLAGRCLRLLRDGVEEEAGSHRVRWDLRDGSGGEVGSGIYLYRLESESGTLTRRLALIR